MIKKALFVALLAFVAFIIWEWITFPDVARLAKENPKTTAFIEARKADLRAAGEDDSVDQQWVSYGRISPYLRRAVLVSEDNAFYQHKGVDVDELKEALRKDWKKRRFAYGGSTITQQLAKNLYLSPSKNPLRKVKELLITRALEDHLTKKRILEIYLNVVEMGERQYGVEAASRFYFQKHASALSPEEAALLAGCLPNPRLMSPAQPNKRLRWRARLILSRLRRWGYLVETEVLAEKKPEPEPVLETPAPDTAPQTETTTAPASQTETSETATPSETSAPTTDTGTAASPPQKPDSPATGSSQTAPVP